MEEANTMANIETEAKDWVKQKKRKMLMMMMAMTDINDAAQYKNYYEKENHKFYFICYWLTTSANSIVVRMKILNHLFQFFSNLKRVKNGTNVDSPHQVGSRILSFQPIFVD